MRTKILKNRLKKTLLIVVAVLATSFLSIETMNYKYNNVSLENYTQQDVSKILQQIVDKSRYDAEKPIYLKVDYEGTLNAWVSEDSEGIYMVVTKEFLKFLKTKDELAFVLGHEWSHVILRHTGDLDVKHYPPSMGLDMLSIMYKDSKEQEFLSDLTGQQLAKLAGYDYTQAGVTFYRLGKLHGEGGGFTHPKNSDRAAYLSYVLTPRAYLHLVVFPVVEKFNEKVFNLIPY